MPTAQAEQLPITGTQGSAEDQKNIGFKEQTKRKTSRNGVLGKLKRPATATCPDVPLSSTLS